MSSIEVDGLEEYEELLKNMELNYISKRKCVKAGIEVIAKGLEEDTPVRSGRLAKIKTTVREKDFSTEGIARSKEFYDIFQNFGTSEQKSHVGYFDRSVEKNSNKAVAEVAKNIFEKMR